MSHIVTQQTEVRDLNAIEAACARLGLTLSKRGRHKMFSNQEADGYALTLPGWHYPAVLNPETGAIAYDNYNEHWGKQIELDKFVQAYTLEYASAQARNNGYSVNEVQLEGGDIQLQLSQY